MLQCQIIKMKKIQFASLIISVAFLAGCAKSSSEIATSYVSPLQYQSYSCDQIAAESARVTARASELGGRLDQASANDAAMTGIGIVLFWPILFALGGTKTQEAEYARVKGEYDALNQIAIQKQCAIGFNPNLAPAPSTASQQTTTTSSGRSETITLTNSPQTTKTPAPSNNATQKLSISEATNKCKALGIATGTEQFGNCVLTLSK
jgi:hypothetical protein